MILLRKDYFFNDFNCLNPIIKAQAYQECRVEYYKAIFYQGLLTEISRKAQQHTAQSILSSTGKYGYTRIFNESLGAIELR